MKVQKEFLLLVAGIVWFTAGFNVMRVGVLASSGTWTPLMLILSVVTYLLFHNLVFRKMVRKHTTRIVSYEESRQPFYRFFDRQAYCIMAFMITFGIGLRTSGLLPDEFIALFYSGIGLSLMIAGISFGLQFLRHSKSVRSSERREAIRYEDRRDNL